jgi:hypothetical protein
MLPVLWLRSGPCKVRVVNADVLLKLLQSVVRPRGQRVESRSVEVAGGHMAVEGCRWDMVGGEPVKGVRQHLD